MTRWLPLAAAAALAALVACAQRGPASPCRTPDAPPSPASLVPPPAEGTAVRFTEAEPVAMPWRAVGGEGLEHAIERLREASPDLLVQTARVLEANALARRAAAERLPTTDVTGGSSFAGGDQRSTRSRSTHDLALEGSWELDFFRRLEHARDAATLDALATEEDRLALMLSLEGEAATAWIDWAAAVDEESVLHETESLLERTRVLVAAQIDAGYGDELALHRIESELAAARADVPGARLDAARARHRLAVLLGFSPDAPLEAPPAQGLPVPPEIPVGLPASLLRRRPDVRAAERRLEAEHARVAQAWAAFWPTVTLDASAGASSISAADVFTGRALFALISPRFTVPFLDAGRLEADRLAEEARRDQAAASWVGVVLVAFRDVADATAGVALHREALDRRREGVIAARKALDLASARFESRLVGYLDVVDSHRALALARLALVREYHDLRAELVRLVRSLAGGWQ